MTVAVIVLMMITSMGIFGYLSKAHNDQNLVSGDVAAKIAVYDEKIKTEKDNIDANRKILKQLDEAVDQVMARSQDEKGADKAVAIRKAQQKDRGRISQEITESQKKISALNDERAPIAAEVRKVEAEVGPVKYIAAFIYGSNPDSSILERAVTWIIILIVIVFDPLAVILLLASQISFQNFRDREQEDTPDPYIADVGEKPTADEIESVELEWKEAGPEPKYEQDDGPLTEQQIEQLEESVKLADPGEHPKDTLQYQFVDEEHEPEFVDEGPNFEGVKVDGEWIQTGPTFEEITPPEPPQTVEHPSGEYVTINGERFHKRAVPRGYVQNEEQQEGGKWKEITKATQITEQEYIEKAKEKREENNTNNTTGLL